MHVPLRRAALAAAVPVLALAVAACSLGSSRAGTAPRAPRHPLVVVLVFDEFSTTSLVDGSGRIDAVRYPNFARLAREATWFPHATASLDETGRAMRSLFTSRSTWRFARPIYAANPRNLFTLLGRRYGMDVSEEVSSMCPPRLCPGSRAPGQTLVLHRLASGRPERFARWLRSVRPRSRPTLYLKHILLPHAPWRYLPSGRRFVDTPTKRLFSWSLQHFNRWLVQRSYQRHLLQVGFTDRLLGRALERLRSTGIYDRALVVVTADNGEGFGRLGNGHELSARNAGDIALTPLFVKLPFQRGGRTATRHVRLVDVVPTIAGVAHVPLRWRVEGRSLFGGAAGGIPRATVLFKRNGQPVRLSYGELLRRAAAARRLKARLFGAGNGGPGLFGIGPHRELQGTRVDRWPRLPRDGTRALLDSPGRLRDVRFGSGVLPVNLLGRLAGGSGGQLDLALAVNGTIVATAPTFATRGRRFFSVQIPETSLRQGANDLRFYAVGRGSALRPL